jgi:hypothetical protein
VAAALARLERPSMTRDHLSHDPGGPGGARGVVFVAVIRIP